MAVVMVAAGWVAGRAAAPRTCATASTTTPSTPAALASCSAPASALAASGLPISSRRGRVRSASRSMAPSAVRGSVGTHTRTRPAQASRGGHCVGV